jgi:uncharacterized protein (DUF2141 family)
MAAMSRDFLAALMLLLFSAAARAQPPAAVVIEGRVVGASGAHVVHVALWTADNFLATPTKELNFQRGAVLHFRFDVPPGRWAVSAYEDRNDNGTLDVGMFGPKEPNGFWRPFKAWRKPRFDDVALRVDTDLSGALVTLR